VSCGVAREEDAVLSGAPEAMREPVSLVAHWVARQALGQLHRRAPHVSTRLVRTYAHPLLAARRHAPAVAVADQRALDPDVEVTPAAVRMHLEAARERRTGRLVRFAGEHAPPAERVHHQRRPQQSAIGEHSAIAATGDGGDLEASVRLVEELLAELAVVEGRPAPRKPVAHRAMRGVEAHRGDLLPY
jgi:hypothetical protein